MPQEAGQLGTIYNFQFGVPGMQTIYLYIMGYLEKLLNAITYIF